jgi:hypothetical protein
MTDETPDNDEGNPPTAKKAYYHIIIEATDVEDTDWQADEVTDLTDQLGRMLSFNGTVWLDDVEYETDEPNPETP